MYMKRVHHFVHRRFCFSVYNRADRARHIHIIQHQQLGRHCSIVHGSGGESKQFSTKPESCGVCIGMEKKNVIVKRVEKYPMIKYRKKKINYST